MRQFKLKNSKKISPKGPRKNVSLSPAVALDGLLLTNYTELVKKPELKGKILRSLL